MAAEVEANSDLLVMAIISYSLVFHQFDTCFQSGARAEVQMVSERLVDSAQL